VAPKFRAAPDRCADPRAQWPFHRGVAVIIRRTNVGPLRLAAVKPADKPRKRTPRVQYVRQRRGKGP
jgi:hypothetical protein